MGASSKDKDSGDDVKTVRNSPTLIGAAVGTAGGPIWALAGSGFANVLTGFPETEWETINTSAAFLLMLVNAAVLVMGLVVASKCAAAGSPVPTEFAAAILLTVPYVVYRAFSPCTPARSVGGILGSIGDLNKSMAPVVLYQMGGFRRAAAAAASEATAALGASAAAAAAISAVGGRRGRR